jgi:hypothetical protein
MRKSGDDGRSGSVAAEAHLRSFICKFDRKHQALIRAVRRALRNKFLTANELVYDNYNFFVIGYSSTERPSDIIVSLAAGASGVILSFPYCGMTLPDPKKILLGSGSQNRFIRLESVDVLARPEVQALVDAAVTQAKTSLTVGRRGKVIIRSISSKQRPRRKDP